MAIDARFAENLCTMLGGHEAAPCFSNMLRTAKRLARKRSITQTEDQDVVADRATILLDTSRKFSAPNLEGHQRLDMFERFLDAIDKRYMKVGVGVIYFTIEITNLLFCLYVHREVWDSVSFIGPFS